MAITNIRASIRPLFVFLFLLGLAQPSLAEKEIVERVVAVVNDEAVYLSELREAALPAIAQNASQINGTDDEELKKVYAGVLESLIDNALLQQVAQKDLLLVSKEEVDRAIESIRQDNGMSEEDLRNTLKQQGITESEYRKSIRQQLIRLKVLNQHVRSRVNVSEDAVRREYQNRVRASGVAVRYRVSQLFLQVQQAGSAIDFARVRAQAEDLYKSLDGKGEEAFIKAGADELGWIDETDIDANVAKQLLTTPVGTLSKPVRTNTGYALYFLHEREIGNKVGSYEEQRETIYGDLTDQAMQKQTAQFLKELRRGAQIRYSL